MLRSYLLKKIIFNIYIFQFNCMPTYSDLVLFILCNHYFLFSFAWSKEWVWKDEDRMQRRKRRTIWYLSCSLSEMEKKDCGRKERIFYHISSNSIYCHLYYLVKINVMSNLKDSNINSPEWICHDIPTIKGVYWNVNVELSTISIKYRFPVVEKCFSLLKFQCNFYKQNKSENCITAYFYKTPL